MPDPTDQQADRCDLVPVMPTPLNADESLDRAAMECLVANPELREEFGRRGREIVLAEFDEKIVIDKTLAVYEDMKDGTRDAGRGTWKA